MSAPSGPLSHALVLFSPPQVFLAGPRGPEWIARRYCEIIITWSLGPRTECQTLLLEMRNSERGSENTPELSECYSEIQALRNPPPSCDFCLIQGRMLCVFFRRCVSGNPTNCFGVFVHFVQFYSS